MSSSYYYSFTLYCANATNHGNLHDPKIMAAVCVRFAVLASCFVTLPFITSLLHVRCAASRLPFPFNLLIRSFPQDDSSLLISPLQLVLASCPGGLCLHQQPSQGRRAPDYPCGGDTLRPDRGGRSRPLVSTRWCRGEAQRPCTRDLLVYTTCIEDGVTKNCV